MALDVDRTTDPAVGGFAPTVPITSRRRAVPSAASHRPLHHLLIRRGRRVNELIERTDLLAWAADAYPAVAGRGVLLDGIITVLAAITNAGRSDADLEPVEAGAADDVVARSTLVRETLAAHPWLAGAPDPPVAQHWIATSGHAVTVTAPPAPSPALLTEVAALDSAALLRRPLPGGFFTSSAPPGGTSM